MAFFLHKDSEYTVYLLFHVDRGYNNSRLLITKLKSYIRNYAPALGNFHIQDACSFAASCGNGGLGSEPFRPTKLQSTSLSKNFVHTNSIPVHRRKTIQTTRKESIQYGITEYWRCRNQSLTIDTITMSESSQQPPKAPRASLAYGTSFLILIQVVSRFLTFASNQLVLRHLSPEIVGVATHLELYYITVLYFSRECVRIAIQREPISNEFESADKENTHKPDTTNKADSKIVKDDSASSQTVVNMSYIAIAIGLPLSGLLACFYQSWATGEVLSTPYFRESLRIVALACMAELATEPFFAVVQQRMLYKERAIVETTAAFARSIATCAISIWAARGEWHAGVLPFAMGYLAYAAALICVYSWHMLAKSAKHNYSFWLTSIQSR